MLEVRNLTAGYGNILVIRDISFDMKAGEALAVIGGNGSGKSTLLWALSGLIRPRSGTIIFDGRDITGLEPRRVVGLGISHGLQGMQIFGDLTVEDNLMLAAFGQRFSTKKLKTELVPLAFEYFPVLREKQRLLASNLSGGEKQMLVMARTLITEPKLLLLDEPSTGLAPLLVEHLFGILDSLRRKFSLTTLLVEQNAEIALNFADRGLVLAYGQIVLEGEVRDLLNSKEVKDVYLGGQAPT